MLTYKPTYKPSMASITLTAIFLLLITIAGGCSDKPDTPSPVEVDRMKLVLTDNQAQLNGKSLHSPIHIDDLKNILGEPSGTLPGDIKVLTWNELGIYCFLSTNGKEVTKISWTLQRPESSERKDDYDKFWPEKPYRGSIVIDGIEITDSTTPETLNESMKNKKFNRTKKFDHTWQRVYRGQTLTILTRNKGKKIYEILLGK